MKKILVTGAAGTIGRAVIKYLLSEGKYEITALDLKSRTNSKKLRKYKKRINVIFGDVTDSLVIEDILKEMDYVIHLAGVTPPLADLNDRLTYEIDFKGTENIVRVLNFYNPNCHLLYASSASVYGKQDKNEVSVSTKPNLGKNDIYGKYKLESEEIIKKKLTNYSIYRLPIVLCNPINDNYLYTYENNVKLEVTTDYDAAYMFVKAIDKIDKVNKKTFNVGGGKYSITTGRELNNELLKYFGYNGKYIKTKLFINKTYYGYVFNDSDKLDELLNYRNDSIASYFLRIKRKGKKYRIRKLIGKLFIKRNKSVDKE